MFEIFANGELIFQPAVNDLRLISPKLTLEMGKAGSLEFGVPSVNKYYTTLEQLRTILTVTDDTGEIFRGRVLNNKKNFSNVRSVYGEGDLAYLVDSVQQAKKYNGKAHALFRSIIAAHNQMVQDPNKQFTVGTITVEDRDVLLTGQSDDERDIYEDAESTMFNVKQIAINSIAENWQNTFDYIQSCLIEYCGGYLRTRRVGNITYIDWLKDYFSTTTQTIEYGKNLLDLTEEINIEDAFSVLIPIGEENLTVQAAGSYDFNGIIHINGSNEIVDTAAVAKYGRILKTNVFDGVTNVNTLLENGVRYLKTNSTVPVTLEITAVDLHLINPNVQKISLGDRVHISSPGHSIDYTGDDYLVCTKIEYDLNNPGNTRYTFGNPKQTLTERYRKDKKIQEDQASRSGGGGGGGGGKAAKDNANTESLEMYKAWCTIDNEHASIDIGTLYKKLYGVNDTNIISETNLKFKSNSGYSNISLGSTYKIWDEDRKKLKNWCGIDLNSTKQDSTVDIFAHADGVNKELAAIQLWAGYAIDETTGHRVYGSRIALQADVVKINAKVDGNIETIASFSRDLTSLNSKVTRIDSDLINMSAKTAYINAGAGYIEIPGGYFQHVFLGNRSITLHTHYITAYASGKIEVGAMDPSGTAHSFNIADTQFYKDKVKALTIKSLTPTITTATDRFTVTMKAVNADGKVLSERTVTTSTAVYNNGVTAGEKNVSVTDVEYVAARRGIRIYLSNGKAPFFSGWKPA